jgi:molybdate transport system substrate-binding protein
MCTHGVKAHNRFQMKKFLQVIFTATCILAVSGAAQAADLVVFAATSLTESLKQLGVVYEKQTGQKVVFNFGASSMLARQIKEGAPADVFFSADETQMDVLANKNLLVPGTRRDRLGNSLVVIVPADSKLEINSAYDLTNAAIKQIALANPSGVPAGVYAKTWLTKKGIWEEVKSKMVPTQNVRGVLAAVASSDVDAGVVYQTDAIISRRVKTAYQVPNIDSPDIRYPMAVLTQSKQQDNAKDFLKFLGSDDAAQIFQSFGFVIRH